MSFKNLSELKAYTACTQIRRSISKLVKKNIPPDEKYRLGDQMIRASRSTTANIAEGHGRYHFQENIQYCRMSRASLYELMDHLSVAHDEDYISKQLFNNFIEQIEQSIRITNGYIKFLRSTKKATNL